jgi:hypothetical protein
MVHSPPHYRTHGGVECIDAIAAALGTDGFRAFLRGQVIKYLWRGPHKEAEQQDYEKARYYLNRLIATFAEQKPEA